MRGSEGFGEIGAAVHGCTIVQEKELYIYDISANAASKSRSGLSKMRRNGGS